MRGWVSGRRGKQLANVGAALEAQQRQAGWSARASLRLARAKKALTRSSLLAPCTACCRPLVRPSIRRPRPAGAGCPAAESADAERARDTSDDSSVVGGGACPAVAPGTGVAWLLEVSRSTIRPSPLCQSADAVASESWSQVISAGGRLEGGGCGGGGRGGRAGGWGLSLLPCQSDTIQSRGAAAGASIRGGQAGRCTMSWRAEDLSSQT